MFFCLEDLFFFPGGKGYEWCFLRFLVVFWGVETERVKRDMEKNPFRSFLMVGSFGIVWDCPSGLKAG